MMLTFVQKNLVAIDEMLNGDDLLAQTLFRENAQRKPCCLSLNNLGVYYSQYGVTLKNGHIRSAKKLGLRLLLKAASYGMDWRNCVSVATALFDEGDILSAYYYLSKAHALNPNCLIKYNIGACLFRLRRFEEAATVFESLCIEDSTDNIIKNCGQHPLLVLAYCKISLHDVHQCIKCLQRYRDTYKSDELLDVFHLRYLCGMYEDALSECHELLEEWHPTKAILSLIFECLKQVPLHTNKVESLISSEYEADWNAVKNHPLLRKKEIGKYSYLPPLICLYQYIV